MTWCSVTA